MMRPAGEPDRDRLGADLPLHEPGGHERGRSGEYGRDADQQDSAFDEGQPPAPPSWTPVSAYAPPPGPGEVPPAIGPERPPDRPDTAASSDTAPPGTVPDLSVGTRVCFLLAALALLLVGYLLLSPLERPSSQGPPFGCGTALTPPSDGFARAVCGNLNRQRALQAGAAGVGAVVFAGGGLLAFGPIRRSPGRWRRPPERAAAAPEEPR